MRPKTKQTKVGEDRTYTFCSSQTHREKIEERSIQTVLHGGVSKKRLQETLRQRHRPTQIRQCHRGHTVSVNKCGDNTPFGLRRNFWFFQTRRSAKPHTHTHEHTRTNAQKSLKQNLKLITHRVYEVSSSSLSLICFGDPFRLVSLSHSHSLSR